MTPETQTRRARKAAIRHQTYLDRCARADGDRKRLHALIQWWMAEIYRLPEKRRAEEIGRLKAITTELNEGGAR